MLPPVISSFISRLRFPYLFVAALALLAVNLVIPDPIPFFDELLLALGAAMIASFKKKDGDDEDDDGRRGGRLPPD